MRQWDSCMDYVYNYLYNIPSDEYVASTDHNDAGFHSAFPLMTDKGLQ